MMKKLLFLAVLGMLTMLVAAPALAQGLPIVQDSDDCPGETVPIGTLESGSGFSCFPAEFQCEGITDQAAFEECVAQGGPTVPEEQYTDPVGPMTPAEPVPTAGTALPDTGGPSLVLLAGLLLTGGGLVMRRR
ncbi:MAG: LPXTG cell wall anchor domain-containing protein [Rubrobacteraceae bacterium]